MDRLLLLPLRELIYWQLLDLEQSYFKVAFRH